MRIDEIITEGKMFWSFIPFSYLFFKDMYGDQSGEYVSGYWGLKGWAKVNQRNWKESAVWQVSFASGEKHQRHHLTWPKQQFFCGSVKAKLSSSHCLREKPQGWGWLLFNSLRVTNTNFHLPSLIHHYEKRLWEFIKWSPKGKYFDLLSNSPS